MHSDATGGKINFQKMVKSDQNCQKSVKNGIFEGVFRLFHPFNCEMPVSTRSPSENIGGMPAFGASIKVSARRRGPAKYLKILKKGSFSPFLAKNVILTTFFALVRSLFRRFWPSNGRIHARYISICTKNGENGHIAHNRKNHLNFGPNF
jgi:hypothetical protein